jgi:hypothetical protein
MVEDNCDRITDASAALILPPLSLVLHRGKIGELIAAPVTNVWLQWVLPFAMSLFQTDNR